MYATRAWWLVVLMACAAVVVMPAAARSFPLHVLAASELRVDPRIAPDRSSLTLVVRLQDDRSAPLRRRMVTLRIVSAGVPDQIVALPLGSDGEAEHTIPIAREQSAVDVTADYAGDGITASRRTEIHVDLDAPYVTVDLVAPPGGVDLGVARAPFIVTLHVGEMGEFPRRGNTVEVREDERTLASGTTDASGRAVIDIDTTKLGSAGVHRLRAATMTHQEHIVGPLHDVLVRAQTSLSLVRVGGDDDPAGAVSLRGALVTITGAPVANASVRVARGDIPLAGARTDAQGRFQARLGPEILAESGVAVRAVFDPTEPWFGASESASLTLTGPAPRKIHWLWVVGPAALAAMGLGVMLVRARLRGADVSSITPDATPPVVWDRVEHVAPSITGGLRVRFVVVDRATVLAVPVAMVRWAASPEWRAVTDESVAVQPARKVEFELGASGYAPRKITGEFSRPGEYVVRVQLRTWREELFDRARPWLRRSGRGTTSLPTLREALKTRAATPDAVAFVELVEAGCYAPENPSAREVSRADELSPVMDPSPTLTRD